MVTVSVPQLRLIMPVWTATILGAWCTHLPDDEMLRKGHPWPPNRVPTPFRIYPWSEYVKGQMFWRKSPPSDHCYNRVPKRSSHEAGKLLLCSGGEEYGRQTRHASNEKHSGWEPARGTATFQANSWLTRRGEDDEESSSSPNKMSATIFHAD